jgi:hypothetical protein
MKSRTLKRLLSKGGNSRVRLFSLALPLPLIMAMAIMSDNAAVAAPRRAEQLAHLASIAPLCGISDIGFYGDTMTVMMQDASVKAGNVRRVYYKRGNDEWRASPIDLNGAHSVTRMPNGDWLIDDTDNDRLIQVADLSGAGRRIEANQLGFYKLSRPHNEIVDPTTGFVYVIDGNQRLFRFKQLDGPNEVWTFSTKDLGYDRSLFWFDGHLHIIDSSRGEVIRIDDYDKRRFTKFKSPRPAHPKGNLQEIDPKIPDFPAGELETTGLIPTSVRKFGHWYYATNAFYPTFASGGDVRPARLIRWQSWKAFSRGRWEGLSAQIPEESVPLTGYFLSVDDGVLFTGLASEAAPCVKHPFLALDLTDKGPLAEKPRRQP